ncbi:MAG: RNase adapter RapZ [Micrococcales bacterium]|nr:RNase adapter RapZ [Actinomycetota bacterium]NCA07235.1 RNase adapter RapZ [Micrococcales bacterium]
MNLDKSYELLIVTGMSGAGRSTVGKALEDMDWYVVDNLPPQMIKPMAELFSHSDRDLPRLAVVIDARGGELFLDLNEHINLLKQGNVHAQMLFLEANDATLVKRYEQVRRPHPLQGNGTITDGINAERTRLLPLREQADYVIDSSELNVYQLAAKVSESFSSEESKKLNLMIQSFGFKYGAPSDADLIADMRFIPNPFWDEALRPYTGEDNKVSDFVLQQDGAEEFISNYVAALQPVLRGYLRENRKHAAIAFGCTGGKHRSVATAIEVAKRLAAVEGVEVRVKHRDLGRE